MRQSESEPSPQSGPRSNGGTRFLENLAYLVPGYRGYKEKELRREEDARLRSRVLAKLHEVRNLLDQRMSKLTEGALDAHTEALDKRIRRLETLVDAVRYAPYGFSGFFDAESVREDTLERILESDLLLFQDMDDFSEIVRGTPFPPRSRSGFALFFESIDMNLDRIEHRLIARDKLLGDR